MSATIYPDRELRPGGRWSTPSLVEDLLQLATMERAIAHVAAGWVPKAPELDDKLRLARCHEGAIGRASALRHHALTLCERDDTALQSRSGWVQPLRTLDASSDSGAVVDGLTRVLPSVLRLRYLEISARIDPLYDSRLTSTVGSAINDLNESGPARSGPLQEALDRALSTSNSELVLLDEVLWEPLDRVPWPARPLGRPKPETGARAHLRALSRLEDADLAGEINDNVMAEICALELMSRSSYEHPGLPWQFHIAVARHASDEARHAEMFRRLLVQRGYDESTMPQHASNYEYAYEFPECERGSERELVWRLLILCTVLEALAIDKLPLEIAIRDTLGQYDLARALDYASTDELFHVENGLRWTRSLCSKLNLDPMIERERVHGRFFGRQRDLRASYLEADPERARREIEILEGPDPDGMIFESRTERELRKRASFSEAECEQVDRWGYNPRSPGASVAFSR
jgi:1,2-phenylacetyl-CoA epoxidase catalytic subunit